MSSTISSTSSNSTANLYKLVQASQKTLDASKQGMIKNPTNTSLGIKHQELKDNHEALVSFLHADSKSSHALTMQIIRGMTP